MSEDVDALMREITDMVVSLQAEIQVGDSGAAGDFAVTLEDLAAELQAALA